MILKLLHRIGLIKAVWLQDHQGEVYLSRQRIDGFGNYWCYVYNFTHVGHVILNKVGSCGGSASDIEKWKYYKE